MPGNAGVAAASDYRMFEFDRESARHQMRIFGEILIAHGRKRRDSGFLQQLGYLPAIALRGPCGDYLVKFAFVPLAQRQRAIQQTPRRPTNLRRSNETSTF